MRVSWTCLYITSLWGNIHNTCFLHAGATSQKRWALSGSVLESMMQDRERWTTGTKELSTFCMDNLPYDHMSPPWIAQGMRLLGVVSAPGAITEKPLTSCVFNPGHLNCLLHPHPCNECGWKEFGVQERAEPSDPSDPGDDFSFLQSQVELPTKGSQRSFGLEIDSQNVGWTALCLG